MPVTIFDTKVFLQNQLRNLTAKKARELKSDGTLSQEQKVTRRIKHYLNEVVKSIQPDPTVFNGDEKLNANITFMGIGAVKEKVKLSTGNIDSIDSILSNVSIDARNALDNLTLETKEQSQTSKTLNSIVLGFGASAVGSILGGALAASLFPASKTPSNTAGNVTPATAQPTTTPSSQPNPAVAIGSLVGSYVFGFSTMYAAKKKIRTNEAALQTLAIMATALCYMKQAPQYRDQIIDSASRLLFNKVGGWAQEFNGWNNAILAEIGPFALVQKKVTAAVKEEKPALDKEKQRQLILSGKNVAQLGVKLQVEKKEDVSQSDKNSVDESKEVTDEMRMKYLRCKR